MTGTTAEQDSTRRAVSPVIGVILMVAISVILAAVVGAFVLEVGDQQETAPNASFASDERVVTIFSDIPSNTWEVNSSQVIVRHTGGEVLSTDQTELKVDGNQDVWGTHPSPNALDMGAGSIDDATEMAPQPDFRQALGKNKEVTISSGEAWNAMAHNMKTYAAGAGPSSHPNTVRALHDPRKFDNDQPPAKAGRDYAFIQNFLSRPCFGYHATGDVLIDIHAESSTPPQGSYPSGWGPEFAYGEQMAKGDAVTVVWTSQSGGKSQTLFKYETQHTATEDGPIESCP